jgi:hypothetical protein
MVTAVQQAQNRREAVALWADGQKALAEGERLAAAPVDAKVLARPTKFGRDVGRRVVPDQGWRQAMFAQPHSEAGSGVVGALLGPRACAVDERNTAFLKRFVAASGWPRISVHGKAAAFEAWLLVQHADDDPAFQRQALALMEPLVPTGEAEGKDFALLYDRVALAEHRLQRYGSQFETVPGGCMRPRPLEEPANVDARRKQVGLPPLAEYAKSLGEMTKMRICS